MAKTFAVPFATGLHHRASFVELKTSAKNLLKGELKRRGITYAGLAEKLAAIGVVENECNLNNKISSGGFTAAVLRQYLDATGAASINL